MGFKVFKMLVLLQDTWNLRNSNVCESVSVESRWWDLKDQSVGFRGIYRHICDIIFILMFPLVYNHLKLRIMFSLAQNL